MYVNYVKKNINYFVFIIHQVNKYGISRWFTESNAKHFTIGALRTITNAARSIPFIVN